MMVCDCCAHMLMNDECGCGQNCETYRDESWFANAVDLTVDIDEGPKFRAGQDCFVCDVRTGGDFWWITQAA